MKRLIEKEDVERAVREILSSGGYVTNKGIYEALGRRGSLTTIVKFLREIERDTQVGAPVPAAVPSEGKSLESRIEEVVLRQIEARVHGVVRACFLGLVEESLGPVVQQMVLNSVGVIERGLRDGGNKDDSAGEFETEMRAEVAKLRGELVEVLESVNNLLAQGNLLMGYLASKDLGAGQVLTTE